jgi:hypothetical protein
MKLRYRNIFLFMPLMAMAIAACQQENSTTPAAPDEPVPEPPVSTETVPKPSDGLPETTGAAVWAHLQSEDYQTNWSLWPGRGELYEGQEPHGMLLTTYLNDAALAAVEDSMGTMPAGSFVVKENYTPDKTLAAVTVMYKVAGYNPDHNDWFFTKHLADGTLDKMPNGMAMEGKLPGCQGCHSAKRDNDYLFTGTITAVGNE